MQRALLGLGRAAQGCSGLLGRDDVIFVDQVDGELQALDILRRIVADFAGSRVVLVGAVTTPDDIGVEARQAILNDVVGVEAGLAGVFAVRVQGKLLRVLKQLVVSPARVIPCVRRVRQAGLLEQVLVVPQEMAVHCDRDADDDVGVLAVVALAPGRRQRRFLEKLREVQVVLLEVRRQIGPDPLVDEDVDAIDARGQDQLGRVAGIYRQRQLVLGRVAIGNAQEFNLDVGVRVHKGFGELFLDGDLAWCVAGAEANQDLDGPGAAGCRRGSGRPPWRGWRGRAAGRQQWAGGREAEAKAGHPAKELSARQLPLALWRGAIGILAHRTTPF